MTRDGNVSWLSQNISTTSDEIVQSTSSGWSPVARSVLVLKRKVSVLAYAPGSWSMWTAINGLLVHEVRLAPSPPTPFAYDPPMKLNQSLEVDAHKDAYLGYIQALL